MTPRGRANSGKDLAEVGGHHLAQRLFVHILNGLRHEAVPSDGEHVEGACRRIDAIDADNLCAGFPICIGNGFARRRLGTEHQRPATVELEMLHQPASSASPACSGTNPVGPMPPARPPPSMMNICPVT